MKKVKFSVWGQVVPKGRPRFRRIKNIITTYTPKETQKYEKLVSDEYSRQVGYMFEITPIEIKIKVVKSFPKSITKKQKEILINQKYVIKKPDIDNYIKIILDALNQVAFRDDNQVARISAEKIYGEEERIEVEIKEIDWAWNIKRI